MPAGRAEVSPGQGSSCVAGHQIDHDHDPDAATQSSQQLNDGARIGDADYWLNGELRAPLAGPFMRFEIALLKTCHHKDCTLLLVRSETGTDGFSKCQFSWRLDGFQLVGHESTIRSEDWLCIL